MNHLAPTLTLGFIFLFSAVHAAPPETLKKPVTDTYHNVTVTDEYRWLENAGDPAVKEWTARQREYARSYLDAIPNRPKIAARLTELYDATSTSYHSLQFATGHFFALKRQPPAEQPILVTLNSPNDLASEKIILDPNNLSTNGSTSINLFWPSPNGKFIAVSLTEGGSEEGNLHFYESATGKPMPDFIPRIAFATAGGSLAWKHDSSGVYYTRYPRAGERPEADLNFYTQVYFHKLGSDEKEDRYIFGKDFPRIAEITIQVLSGEDLLIGYQLGDGGDFAHHLVRRGGRSQEIAGLQDGVKSIAIGPSGDLFLFSRKDAPRGKVLHLNAGQTDLQKATVVVPESDAVIQGYDVKTLEILPTLFPTRNNLFVVDIVGGPSQIRNFDQHGRLKGIIPSEPVSAIEAVVVTAKDQLYFQSQSYLRPAGWFRYYARNSRVSPTQLIEKSPINYDDCELIRDFAASRDGTKVPITIIRKIGTELDGRNPTLLYGYGGYGIVLSPSFLSPAVRLWLDHGGIYCVANLRGGGEFGEEWHKAGNLTRKQNVFDDFIACAEFLIKSNYTNPQKLAIMGGSNGGLLMGAVLTQRPELFRAVVSFVGIYDMLRVELDPNGSFNVPEFGTVKDADQFKALHAYSPYHHVKDGAAFPAVLFVTGENDHRVNPMNSRKMTARLQAANSSNHPILLRTSANAGHGMGSALSETIDQAADVEAFLEAELIPDR